MSAMGYILLYAARMLKKCTHMSQEYRAHASSVHSHTAMYEKGIKRKG